MKSILWAITFLSISTLSIGVAGAGESSQISNLTRQLCNILRGDGSLIVSDSYKKIKNHITKYGGYGPNPFNKQMIEFLNQHNKNMICSSTKKHYMHEAIEAGRAEEIFYSLFRGKLRTGLKGNPLIDVNAACRCGPNGEWQTPLDFMQDYKGTRKHLPAVYREAERIEKTLRKRYQAKYFHELPQDVQQGYIDSRPN